MASEQSIAIPKLFTVDSLAKRELGRLLAKIRPAGLTECWEWTSSTKNGYGILHFRGKHVYVHRLVYAWLHGPLPLGRGKHVLQIDHMCRNRLCCNPCHLRLVSPRENVLSSNGVSAIASRKTHCPKGHPLDGINACNGKRFCKTCQRAYDRKRRKTEHRKAAARDYYQRNREVVIARVSARAKRLRLSGST
jgi:hypothetical protein